MQGGDLYVGAKGMVRQHSQMDRFHQAALIRMDEQEIPFINNWDD